MIHNSKMGFIDIYFKNTYYIRLLLSKLWLLVCYTFLYMCHRVKALPVTALDLVKYQKNGFSPISLIPLYKEIFCGIFVSNWIQVH